MLTDIENGHDERCEADLIEGHWSACQCADRATIDPTGAPRAVVGLVRNEDGEILIGLKGTVPGHPFSDQWHPPGGKVEPGEGDYSALIRELAEEAGLTHISVTRLLGERIAEDGMVIRLYLVHTRNITAVAGDDLVDARFVPQVVAREMLAPHAWSWWPELARSIAFGSVTS